MGLAMEVERRTLRKNFVRYQYVLIEEFSMVDNIILVPLRIFYALVLVASAKARRKLSKCALRNRRETRMKLVKREQYKITKLYPKKLNSCASDNDSRPLPLTLILVWRYLGVTFSSVPGGTSNAFEKE